MISMGSPEDHPISKQNDNRADDSANKACFLIRTVPSDRLTEVCRDQCAGDTKQNCHDEPSRIASRHKEFRDQPSQQPNDDRTDERQHTLDLSDTRQCNAAGNSGTRSGAIVTRRPLRDTPDARQELIQNTQSQALLARFEKQAEMIDRTAMAS